MVAEEPDNVYVPVEEQTASSGPAETVGFPLMVRTMKSVVEVQVPWPDAVRVRVTVPAVLSAVLGV